MESYVLESLINLVAEIKTNYQQFETSNQKS